MKVACVECGICTINPYTRWFGVAALKTSATPKLTSTYLHKKERPKRKIKSLSIETKGLKIDREKLNVHRRYKYFDLSLFVGLC